MRKPTDDDPRHHCYLVKCKCNYVLVCDKAPIKAERAAYKHARQKPSHEVTIFDLTTLSVARTHVYDPLPQVEDVPPF